MVRIAAGFDKSAHGIRRLRLAQQDAVHAAAQDLAELPGVEVDIGGVDAVDRRFDDDGRGAVAGARRPAVDEAAHILGEARHVERAVLHPDIDVVGPGARVRAALRVGQHMPAMAADVVDRLVLLQQFERAVDAVGHACLLWPIAPGAAVDRRSYRIIVRAAAGVAEWQTRQTQNPLSERTWEFKSPRPHHPKMPHTAL